MRYELTIGTVQVLHGNIIAGLILIFILLFILSIALWMLWKKIRENEVLKYEFITIIAHKFRTPLTQIKWTLETLIPEEPDPLKRESLEEVARANQGLIGLTGSLIEMTDSDSKAKTSYKFEPVLLCDLVRNVGDALKNTYHEKNIAFSVECPDPNIKANIDKDRIIFVIQTLLENACLYTPPGRRVDAIITEYKGNAVISVVDNGIGMERGDLANVFTKFYRSGNAQKMYTEGFGIGLFLAYSVVKRNKGKIEVFSEGHDKGTTFTVTLPLAK